MKCPQFAPNAASIMVGNSQYCATLFGITITFIIDRLYFKYFTSEIHGHLDVVVGIKNLFEIQADLYIRNSDITFHNRSIPL